MYIKIWRKKEKIGRKVEEQRRRESEGEYKAEREGKIE